MFRRDRQLRFLMLQVLLVVALSWRLLAQTAAEKPPASPQEPPKQVGAAPLDHVPASSSTMLSAGDLIEVSVFGVPDLATKTRISNSGDVYLPLIDYVHVADLTVDEAQGVIQKRLEDGGFVRSPHVSIFVDESAAQAISVLGEVSRPGPYPAIGDRHLFDLISAAGGLTTRAGRLVTIIHRDESDKKTEIHLSSDLANDTEHNVELKPGDTIIVSQAGIVYVVGDVARPSGFAVEDDNLTVLKALALAGGETRTSSLNHSKILRQTPNGIQEIPVQLKKVIQAKTGDIPLIRGDVLFVPGSALKSASYRTAQSAMSVATALSIVAVRP